MLHFKLLLFYLSTLSYFFSQGEFVACQKIEAVQSAIKSHHFKAIDINETERKEVLALYVNLMDDDNYFFTTTDISDLQQIASEKGLCESFQQSVTMFQKALKRYDSIAAHFYQSKIELKKGENFLTNLANNAHLRSTEKEYAHALELSFKYDYLNAIYDKLQADSTLEKKITPKLDEDVRKRLAQTEKKFIARKLENLKTLENHLLSDFLNALALRFDPHSAYFSLEAKTDFEEELSTEKLVYGIQFIENEDFDIEIASLTPGSSAWNSNVIKEEDILVEIIDYKGVKHEMNNKGMTYLTQVLNQDDAKEATFVVKHKNGGISQVKLVKTKIENIENSFKGYLLSDSKSKLGYIALPSFYTDFEGDVQLGCANDVAKEILLLKKDSIQGLILDLRNNGGGSLKEAIELSGLFIDEGPMSIYQAKDEKPYLLKDMNRGTVYNGPLIILVNSMSASASEFFAGCMQDYKRAVIVGDRTYGKGTAQSVYPVNHTPDNADFVKVTNGKFYHVSSRSNQELGIVPDILLEDEYANMDYYLETNELYHLKNDSTAKKAMYKALFLNQMTELKAQSIARTSVNPDFDVMKKRADLLAKRVQNDQKIPLDLESFLTYRKENKLFWEEIYSKEKGKELAFKIENHSFTNRLLILDENEQKFNQKIMDNLKKDIILHESFLILKDLITFDKTK